jgi:hypothetical protein
MSVAVCFDYRELGIVSLACRLKALTHAMCCARDMQSRSSNLRACCTLEVQSAWRSKKKTYIVYYACTSSR